MSEKLNIKRFIPVYTGNTDFVANYQGKPAVYPCVYREHNHSPSTTGSIYGLSLCIQGTQIIPQFHLNQVRFIPVYTGNTDRHEYLGASESVYPCVYREHKITYD